MRRENRRLAYLRPDENIPYLILAENGQGNVAIGFILLCRWLGGGDEYTSWSYFIDTRFQGNGYGRAAARLAIRVLKAAAPNTGIKLSVGENNQKGAELYQSNGFEKTDEMDRDDLVFIAKMKTAFRR